MTKKVEFNVMSKIKKDDKVFVVLFNKLHGLYFLREDGGKLDYPTTSEYLELKKLYNSVSLRLNFDKIKVAPLARLKNRLISIALLATMAIEMVGCGKADNAPDSYESNLQRVVEVYNDYGISLDDGIIINDGVYSVSGFDADNPKAYTALEEYWKDSHHFNKSYDEVVSIDEFAKKMNLQGKTYDDVIEVLEKNENIDKKLKAILKKNIKNLQKSKFDINLALLYYNIKNLKVEYVENFVDEIGNEYSALGLFDEKAKTLKILKSIGATNLLERTAVHEVLGHAATTAFDEEKRIFVTPDRCMLGVDATTLPASVSWYNFGSAYGEGLADLITAIATGEPLEYSVGYSTEAYQIQLISELYDIPLSEIANNGVEAIISKLHDNGIADPESVIAQADTELISRKYGDEPNYNLTTVLSNLFNARIEQLYSEGMSKEDISQKIDTIYDNTRRNIQYYTIQGEDGEERLIVYNSAGTKSYTLIDESYIFANAYETCNSLHTEKSK